MDGRSVIRGLPSQEANAAHITLVFVFTELPAGRAGYVDPPFHFYTRYTTTSEHVAIGSIYHEGLSDGCFARLWERGDDLLIQKILMRWLGLVTWRDSLRVIEDTVEVLDLTSYSYDEVLAQVGEGVGEVVVANKDDTEEDPSEGSSAPSSRVASC
ncbi:hypothetical protein Lal_00020368 [Lupinus albus]|nr:hypothetical protein Lal_00020368 [Lupinus albus]